MMRRWPFGGTCDVRISTAALTNANGVNPKTYHFADSSKRLTGMPQTKAARKRVTMIAELHQWSMTEVITKKDSGRSIPFFPNYQRCINYRIYVCNLSTLYNSTTFFDSRDLKLVRSESLRQHLNYSFEIRFLKNLLNLIIINVSVLFHLIHFSSIFGNSTTID